MMLELPGVIDANDYRWSQGMPRVWTVPLPFERPPLTTNEARSRAHYHRQHDAKQTVEDAVVICLRQAKVPRLEQCCVKLVWHRKNKATIDADALTFMAKACLDGMKQAGVIKDDNAGVVPESACRVIIGDPPARIELVIREGIHA